MSGFHAGDVGSVEWGFLDGGECDDCQNQKKRDGKEKAAFEIGAIEVASLSRGEGEHLVELAEGAGSVAEDVADGHEKREQRVGHPSPASAGPGEIC